MVCVKLCLDMYLIKKYLEFFRVSDTQTHQIAARNAFLDKNFSRKKQMVEGQKDENVKKSQIGTREKMYKDDSSDSDTSSNEKRGTKKPCEKYTSSTDESEDS